GYIQVHKQGFWDDQTLENSFDAKAVPASLKKKENIAPRLESFALASSGDITKGVLVVGIDPQKETSMTGLEARLTAGAYLTSEDHAALIAEGLATLLKLSVGDTLILVSQGYQGRNAAGAYPIKGVAKFGAPDLNKQLVYLPLPLAREFYGTGDRLTSLAINLPGRGYLKRALTQLHAEVPQDEFEIMDYRELMPELIQAQELDTAGAMLILWVLYALIGFGLFGTILMMTRERSYELGVLMAIGTKKRTLTGMLWVESLLIGLSGALLGILLSLPFVWYLHTYPIELTGKTAEAYISYGMEPVMQSAFEMAIFVKQAIIIFVISSLLSLYSLWYVLRLKPVSAMRE
ncbi:MAG: ABC transporter permease, partial [Saprospiraceae bacterium]